MSDKPAPANRTSTAARVGAGKKPRKARAPMEDVLCRRTMADEDIGFITVGKIEVRRSDAGGSYRFIKSSCSNHRRIVEKKQADPSCGWDTRGSLQSVLNSSFIRLPFPFPCSCSSQSAPADLRVSLRCQRTACRRRTKLMRWMKSKSRRVVLYHSVRASKSHSPADVDRLEIDALCKGGCT